MELITHMNIYLKIKFIENGIIFTNNRKLIINNLPSRNSNNLNNPDIKKSGKQMQMRFQMICGKPFKVKRLCVNANPALIKK